jgi:hypothetical protein
MNAVYLFHLLTDPILKCQIWKKAEELRITVKRKLKKGEYYSLDTHSDDEDWGRQARSGRVPAVFYLLYFAFVWGKYLMDV